MALPDAAHAGRRDRVAKFPHFVGDADLAEGRLLQRKFNDPLRDLGRGPVRQDRLLAADLLQRQLAAFVIEILEAVEAIAAIAEHLAGLAHIAKLPGELQQAHLSLDNLLVLRHRWCPHKRPRPGSPQPWPAPRPPRLSLRPYDTKCRIKYQLVQRDRPDIARKRARWKAYQRQIDPKRLVFIDETWAKTNMAPLRGWGLRGKRLKARPRLTLRPYDTKCPIKYQLLHGEGPHPHAEARRHCHS